MHLKSPTHGHLVSVEHMEVHLALSHAIACILGHQGGTAGTAILAKSEVKGGPGVLHLKCKSKATKEDAAERPEAERRRTKLKNLPSPEDKEEEPMTSPLTCGVTTFLLLPWHVALIGYVASRAAAGECLLAAPLVYVGAEVGPFSASMLGRSGDRGGGEAESVAHRETREGRTERGKGKPVIPAPLLRETQGLAAGSVTLGTSSETPPGDPSDLRLDRPTDRPSAFHYRYIAVFALPGNPPLPSQRPAWASC
ncbi:hypothetical protein XELAEV_18032787mg [Xenopus laevis]|uniref:Uncharacterized protein n=1 Tax=Xenopus laevis TaxID=8355 RepID=A0A974CI57_XENLA|nr:hypothetical protein XELAEV_18032787mg [Xenopus laevis]